METRIEMVLVRPGGLGVDRRGYVRVDAIADIRMGDTTNGSPPGFVVRGLRALAEGVEIALSEPEQRAARALLVEAYLRASGVRPGPAYVPATACEREVWCVLQRAHPGQCSSQFM